MNSITLHDSGNSQTTSSSSMEIQDEKIMPLMGFGTFIGNEYNRIHSEAERKEVVEQAIFNALKAGYRHLDCASNYENLEWVGNALKKAFLPISENGLNLTREEIWITSKESHPSAHLLKRTLEALGLTHLDLYLLHFPSTSNSAIWEEMNRCVEQGLVKNIGVSNFYKSHMKQLLIDCEEKNFRFPYANEIEISPWVQEEDFYQYCKERNIRLIAYSPLAYANCSALLDTPQLVVMGEKLGATAAQVALAWNMTRGVAVIPSSRSEEHIQSNWNSLQLIPLLTDNAEFMESIQGIDMHLCSTETADYYKKQSFEFEYIG